MQNKPTSLFSLDLRIQNQIIKLKVYEQDNITDIIERLFGSISLKASSKDKLKSKLEDQFRKISQKKQLSQAIKNKLSSLLDESKIVIMAIETDKNDLSMNETPFKILQESVMNGRKTINDKPKRNFHYLNEDNLSLNVNYQSQEKNQNKRPYVLDGDAKFENVILRTKNVSPQKMTTQNVRQTDRSQQIIHKSNHDDRKWQSLAYKNSNQIQSYSRPGLSNFQPQKLQANTMGKILQQKLGYRGFISRNDYKGRQTNEQYYQRPLSTKISQRITQEPSNNQTFQQYKMNRYRSNNNFIAQQLQSNQSYRAISNTQYMRPSKSSTRLNYNGQNSANTIRNYDTPNTCVTIKNYDTHLSTKGLSGAVSYKNLKGKFNYLGND